MKRTRLVVAALVLLVSLVPSSVDAQMEQQLRLQLVHLMMDESALEEGRLPPQDAQLATAFRFDVSFPAVAGFCPFQPVTVQFAPINNHAWATTSLSVSSVSKSTGQTANPLNDKITAFDTVLQLVVSRDAPAFATRDFGVKATAVPGGSLASGCNLRPSYELWSMFLFKVDYFPDV